MAKTQDIRRRIRSIRNTMQLTRAMKMVSAAKLRRSQERVVRARPYAKRTAEILRSLASRANPELHPLLQQREGGKTHVVVVTGDRGLCGGFNAGAIRLAFSIWRDLDPKRRTLSTIGRKGREYFNARASIERQWTDLFRNVELSTARGIADWLIERYLSHEDDRILLVYNEFKSAIQARPVVHQLLPIEAQSLEPSVGSEDYLYEPSPQDLFSSLLPHYVEIQVFTALLESIAAEHAARMAAMDSATRNAGELIESLTLSMNRVRQASITTEIIEVVSGAQALN
jgi:F-type H+-transporting ATPase subunit gamma